MNLKEIFKDGPAELLCLVGRHDYPDEWTADPDSLPARYRHMADTTSRYRNLIEPLLERFRHCRRCNKEQRKNHLGY